MEQNTPVIAKKIWNLMRVAFYMLRKGICKRKILLDLNLAMKRGKLAGKAFQNLMFHHHNHHNHDSISKIGLDGHYNPQGEYEFSCNNTPLYRHYFTNNNNKSKTHLNKSSSLEEDMKNIEAVNNMFDMMKSNDEVMVMSSPSPALLGFGRSPAVRPLRVTDSPFPFESGDDDKRIDVAADEFINKFYNQLKQQKYY